jgi:hypothetical protein
VSAGIEKYVVAQAAGAELAIDASSVKVTARVPLAATVTGEVRVCDEPLVPVE